MGRSVWMGVGCLCPPVRNDIVTPRHLFLPTLTFPKPCPIRLSDDVPEEIKKRRHMEVVDAFRAEALALNQSRIGEKHLVLVEGRSKKSEHALVGRNDAFVKVVFPKVCGVVGRGIVQEWEGVGLDLQLGISKAESGSRFEKNSPPEVLTVVTGSKRHRSRRSWSCSTEI